MTQMPNQHESHEAHHDFDISNPEGRMSWFFKEFWPIMIPASFFLFMNAIPLTLSGAMHNPFSSADVVWGGYGILLIAEFLLAVAIIALAPRFLGIYMLILSIYSLIFAESGRAWTAGFISDGRHTWMISTIGILFLTYVLIGNLVFMNALRNQRKAALK